LIPRLEDTAEDPLEAVRCELESLYEDGRKRSSDFPPTLQTIQQIHEGVFGDRAEFWLLLATGYRIAKPYPIYGNPASGYYGRADSCQDMDTVTYLTLKRSYADYLIEQLEARSQRSPAQMDRSTAAEYSLAAARLRFSCENLTVTS
jgi:hypothetical protein